VFAPSRGYLEFPTESIRISITDIDLMISTSMDINITDIHIMDINITDRLGSFREGFEGACASRARELSGRTHQGAGIALSASRTDGIRFSI
jgi:hypothetical protein